MTHITTKRKSGLIHDLLTENRYWTFWSADWSIRVNVFWGGSVKWEDVKKTIAIKYFPNSDFGYERQIVRQHPDIKFA